MNTGNWIDLFFVIVVTALEVSIVTAAQYILFGTKRIDKSLAVIAVIQLAHDSILAKQYFEMDSLGYTEMMLCVTNLVSYVSWAFWAKWTYEYFENKKAKKIGILHIVVTGDNKLLYVTNKKERAVEWAKNTFPNSFITNGGGIFYEGTNKHIATINTCNYKNQNWNLVYAEYTKKRGD